MARPLIRCTYDVYNIYQCISIAPELQIVLYHLLYLILHSYESYSLNDMYHSARHAHACFFSPIVTLKLFCSTYIGSHVRSIFMSTTENFMKIYVLQQFFLSLSNVPHLGSL